MTIHNSPNKMPHWHIQMVRIRARVGSPRLDDTANGWMNGMMPSFAMACRGFLIYCQVNGCDYDCVLIPTWSRRGAPVKLWSPAPSVDRNDPIKITHSFGHAMFATTSLPPIDWPNLIAGINYIRSKCFCSLSWCTPKGFKTGRKSFLLVTQQ